MTQNHPERGSWTTVKSQGLKVGDELWVDGEWMLITASAENNRAWTQEVHVNGIKLSFRINGDVMIKERGNDHVH